MADKYIERIPLQPGMKIKMRVVVSKRIRRKGWKKPLWILKDADGIRYTISSDVSLTVGDGYIIDGTIKRSSVVGDGIQYHIGKNWALMFGGK